MQTLNTHTAAAADTPADIPQAYVRYAAAAEQTTAEIHAKGVAYSIVLDSKISAEAIIKLLIALSLIRIAPPKINRYQLSSYYNTSAVFLQHKMNKINTLYINAQGAAKI